MMKKLTMMIMMVTASLQLACGDVWEDLAKYTMSDANGKGTQPNAVHKLIINAPASEHGAIEDKLIAIIESKDAADPAKWVSCIMLQRVGSDKCVPALEKLLHKDVMSHYARLALERMKDSSKAGEALRNALDSAPDKLKGGIASSLGERGDVKAVKQIAKLAESRCGITAKSALIALGKIGGKDALNALQEMEVCDEAKSAHQDALLECAIVLKDASQLEKTYKNAKCSKHRAVAMCGMLIANESKGVSLIVAASTGADKYLRDAARRMIVTEKSIKLTSALASSIGSMAPENQAAMLALLGDRGDRTALDAICGLMNSENTSVSDAAIAATGLLGDAGTVKKLLALPADKKSMVSDSIASMVHEGVDAVLIAEIEKDMPKTIAIEALGTRNVEKAVGRIKKLTTHQDAGIRRSAWSTLGMLAGKADLDELMKVAVSSSDKSDIRDAKKCIKNICMIANDKDGCIDILSAYFDKADASTKAFILDMSVIASGDKGLELARAAVKSEDKELSKNGVRALAAWPDVRVSDDLIELSKNSPDEVVRILALRGFISKISIENNKNLQLKRLNEAKGIVKRVEEKRLLVSEASKCKADVLDFLAAYVADPDVSKEASGAFVSRARHSRNLSQVSVDTLNALANAPDADRKLAKEANKILAKKK